MFEVTIRDDRSFRFYEDGTTIPIENERKILMAVVKDNVVLLKNHLDSPKWYRITDKHGLSLLHIAILENSKKCFDFLLSVPNFPLEMVSDYGETPLATSILIIDLDKHGSVIPGSDYFAFKLIQHNADIFYRDNFNYSSLSSAALKHHIPLSSYFIQEGVDLNSQDISGNTALHHTFDHGSLKIFEFVGLLLESGADPRISNYNGLLPFELSVLRSCDRNLQEVLFWYTYDEWFGYQIHLNVILRLAQDESELLNFFEDAFIDDFLDRDYIQLFYLDVKFLKILIEKFPKVVKEVLQRCRLNEWSRNAVTFEKILIILNSYLRESMIECIGNIEDDILLDCLIDSDFEESLITEIFCFLLSYNLNISERILQKIYKEYNHCQLFEILLHMDIEMTDDCEKEILPTLMYNCNEDLQSCLKSIHKYSKNSLMFLLDYFANTDLNELCFQIYGDNILPRLVMLPQVPLLVELARNVFRKFFISKFGIKNSRQFYTLINNLDICNIYKKIIVYERKLY